MIEGIQRVFPVNPLKNLSPEQFPVDSQHFCSDLEVLVEIIKSFRPKVLFEFGSWKGHSAILFAETMAGFQSDFVIVCIDTWLGGIEHYLNADFRHQLFIEDGRPTIWERFVGNVIRSKHCPHIYPLPMTTSIAHDFLLLAGCQADAVYVDAGRRFGDVSDDLKFGADLLKESGVIFGDDYHAPPVRNAILQFAKDQHLYIGVRSSKWVLSQDPPSERGFECTVISPSPRSVGTESRSEGWSNEIAVLAAPREFLSTKRQFCQCYPRKSFALLKSAVENLALPETLRLRHVCVKNGHFLVGRGGDGVVLNESALPVEPTLQFVDPRGIPTPEFVKSNAMPLKGNVFLATDIYWGNYYHWICLAVSKFLLATKTLEFNGLMRFAVPDYDLSMAAGQRLAFSKKVWLQSLSLVGDTQTVLSLAPGIYRAAEIHFFAMNSSQVAPFTLFEQTRENWREILDQIAVASPSPERICVLRRDVLRVRADETLLLQLVAKRYGFQCGYLEDLDFLQQACLFRNARHVIAAHGAGLSNMLFMRPGGRVTELNRILESEKHLRPWFYMLARRMDLQYNFVDLTGNPGIEEALDDLFSGGL